MKGRGVHVLFFGAQGLEGPGAPGINTIVAKYFRTNLRFRGRFGLHLLPGAASPGV